MSSNVGNSVLSWYVEAEDMLQDVLRYVPYCSEHKSVWSPKLVTILHEVCSQLDSLWFYQAKKLWKLPSMDAQDDQKRYFFGVFAKKDSIQASSIQL